ncbi:MULTISPECIES: photosystem II reaction center PsbP [unclassified Leptolyngbya]|uniref:photosystem II reaction center PsbP n=1 Tax=unclassified Leptolyngbya TaxID=2650499 RepID=UPI001682F32A|nr:MULTISPECIES: photosystem II reaction center PsbP [unclassified Leptolyngbya]MBD1911566.1 photosystem II reaction center PsbP family protein [Leptolyngbya sp. FACHB-8]MBD2155600.1 photosystem II reaction center PsbP family protein [Leptolyngbya sp. FACHB-16]
MLKRIAVLLLVSLVVILQGCSVGTTLQSYADNYDGYEFLYPNGWVTVKVPGGPDVVLHDLIEETENVSVIINPVPDGKTLEDLGTPSEVGYRLQKQAIAPADSGRQAELISADRKDVDGKTYYLLEYEVKLPNQIRHNLASVIVRRGQLFTFNLSTTQRRWEKVQDQFRKVVNSFSVY